MFAGTENLLLPLFDSCRFVFIRGFRLHRSGLKRRGVAAEGEGFEPFWCANPRFLLSPARHLWFIATETHLESKHDATPFLPRPDRNPGQPGPNPRADRSG